MPAAALSAYGRTDDRVQALLAGFQIHVPKPVQPAELVAVVASLARRGPATLAAPSCVGARPAPFDDSRERTQHWRRAIVVPRIGSHRWPLAAPRCRWRP